MLYSSQHFYVREYLLNWCVCEHGSDFCLSFTTKYRATFIRNLLMKWLCKHEYSRLYAVLAFIKHCPKSLHDWSVVRAKFVSIDKLPYSAI